MHTESDASDAQEQRHCGAGVACAPLFTSLPRDRSDTVALQFEGSTIVAPAGISVAAALLLSDAGAFRFTPVTSSPRAAYCMMGVCFDCLVEVDGVPNCQACLTPVREGMVVRRQRGACALALPAAEGADGC